jgi:hypothetical protein
MALDRATRRAIARYGKTVNGLARSRYGISGQQLLLRLVQGESGGIPNRTSRAGAKGLTQFMPGSRKIAIDKYGVDPWGSADDAVHAAALHLRGKINGSTGLEGYNPGDSSYAGYILGQKVPGDLKRSLGVSSKGKSTGGSQHPQNVTTPLDAGAVQGLTTLLQSQLQHPQRPSGSIPALPSYAAQPTLASPPIETSGRSSEPASGGLDSLLASVSKADGSLPAVSTQAQGSAKGQPGKSAKPAKGSKRVVTFDGKAVRSDFAKQLAWARKHGWKGTVTSGFRTKSQQMAAAKGFGLQHYGPKGPLGSNHVYGHPGAVDVSDPDSLEAILKRYPGKRTLFRGMKDDPVHFSPTGH